jgi:hypothetical protein
MPYNNVVKLCAAGSGKTYGICYDALAIVAETTQQKRVLITTFTNNGIDTIQAYITQLNQGIPSNNVVVCTWFQFLLSEFIRPYQSFIIGINEVKAFDFENNYPRYKLIKGRKVNMAASGKKERYLSGHYNVMSNHASELAVHIDEKSGGLAVNRIREIYSHIYIDEIQDMAGYDIDLILLLMKSSVSVTCVGDYKQVTYKTNTGSKNKKSSGKHIGGFCDNIVKQGLSSVEKILVTRRFNQSICDFANKLFPNGDAMISPIKVENGEDGVFLIQPKDVNVYFDYYHPTVLKYDKNTTTMGRSSYNFGGCKGMTFDRALVFPNKPLEDYIQNNTKLKAPEKYYVGVTRPRRSLAIVIDSFPSSQNQPFFQKIALPVGAASIEVMRYVFDAQEA